MKVTENKKQWLISLWAIQTKFELKLTEYIGETNCEKERNNKHQDPNVFTHLEKGEGETNR